jgi:hypothetical protein
MYSAGDCTVCADAGAAIFVKMRMRVVEVGVRIAARLSNPDQ